ncbi:thiamine pyrophosphate-binding protein [Paenibacillus sp. GCM10012307]|uniref:Thiamine pyrophosphate-binding protein n=1 Tax=Paenibacillus roseus TaxID=2798579 RepID=A0A934J9C7_9BACL|nr:thiamine pyrophosphate-binding protein [Paenibacillus roseus]MBJ6363036.1 thiamine pyrophosphate-binding protein [Paenibacillus roseus]
MKVARAVFDYLLSGGVQYVFGIPAGSVNGLYNELYDLPQITPVVTKHEGAASYMAAAYAKYSRGLSVCIGCSGPGGTNLVTGVANAMREHLPVLFITGAVPVSTVGLNASQELDAEPIFRPVTKYSVTVRRGADLPVEIAKAVGIALSGVPGPVHVAIPIDVQLTDIDDAAALPEFPVRAPVVPDAARVRQAARELVAHKSGYIFAGQGARECADAVLELAELLDWPIVTTPQAKGLLRDDHPLHAGVFGFAGHEQASALINDGDGQAIVVIGSSLGETATNNWNPNLTKDRYFIQLDFDKDVFHRKYPVDLPILGDIHLSLLFLIDELQELGLTRTAYERPSRESLPDDAAYSSRNVLTKLQHSLPASALYTIDIGEFMSYVIRYMNVHAEGSFDINVHFGAMGSAIGAAIGAKLADPERPVVCLTGDGCFFMHGMEVLTAKEYELPILFVVMNNARLGMVYHGHTLQYKRSHARFEQQPINIAAVAQAMDIPSYRVETMDDLDRDAIAAMVRDLRGPAVLEISLVDNNIPPMGDRVKFLSSFVK